MLDDGLAAPAGAGADQVGLAVAGGVKQPGQLGVSELADFGDVVLVGGFLVDQVALRRAGRVHAPARELDVAAGGFIELGVMRVPVVGHEGGVAVGHGNVRCGVFDFLDGLHVVAKLRERTADQQRLESLFGQCAL